MGWDALRSVFLQERHYGWLQSDCDAVVKLPWSSSQVTPPAHPLARAFFHTHASLAWARQPGVPTPDGERAAWQGRTEPTGF